MTLLDEPRCRYCNKKIYIDGNLWLHTSSGLRHCDAQSWMSIGDVGIRNTIAEPTIEKTT